MSIDFSRTSEHDYEYANNILLAPTISYVGLLTGNPEFDIWKLFSWLFVSYYWTFLNDFGQISPTTYIPMRDWATANFSQPTFYPSTNNIFINETLFETYSSYMNDTILPLLNYSLGAFSPLAAENRLNAYPTTFLREYNCMERHLKAPINLMFSVFTVVFAFISGLYTLIMCFSARHYKKDGLSPVYITI